MNSHPTAQFRLHCRTRSFAFYATSNEERADWLADINKSITGGYSSEAVDKEYLQKQKDLATAPTQEASPPADLSMFVPYACLTLSRKGKICFFDLVPEAEVSNIFHIASCFVS